MSVATRDRVEPEPSICTSTSTYTSSSIYNSTSFVEWSQPCRRFEFDEILSATEYFNESSVIGKGGFGKVYKGNIVNGASRVNVAIKRMDSQSKQGAPEFWAEVETVFHLRHCNLVSLIGYCDHGNEMILVYEYIPNGSLYDHLHSVRTLLSWPQRLKICIDVARGLDYLHTSTGNKFGIVHRDVKSANILLNKSWAAKITDFGFSKRVPRDQDLTYVSTLVVGTFGYIDPDYRYSGKLTTKSDVYAFGVVLLEVLCRKLAVDKTLDEEQWGLATWALDSIKEGRLKHIIDPDIRDEISPECLKGFVQIAERCLERRLKHRPTMAEVVSTLESVLSLHQNTNNLFQIAVKTKFVDKFSTAATDKHSGPEFGFRMPNKRKLLMLRKKIHQEGRALSFINFWMKILRLKTNYFGSIKFFGAKELEKATNNYAEDRILGRGAQGTVYKGILPDKGVVAIKRHMILSQSRLEKLITEIVILEHFTHENVVKLLGCCFETEGALLVYEFVTNGTLNHLIHNETSDTVKFSWDSRLRIAHESANALAHLHTYETISIIHGDVKSSNILLDENYTAKVSDFGSSTINRLNNVQLHTHAEGTLGYFDPEYIRTCRVTRKTDVYGFGVVLTELLTRKKPFDRKSEEDDKNLSTYFVKKTKENRLREIVDPQVLEEATDEQLRAACDLAYRCLEAIGGNRPSMKEVTMELETIRKLGETSLG